MTVRKFVTQNKIFFETIAATLLSVMAVVVALSQATLLELQTRVAEVQVLPQFYIGTEVSNEGKVTWVINNAGAGIHDFEISPGCLLVVTGRTGAGASRVLRIPVTDCVSSTASSTGGAGTLARAHAWHTTGEIRNRSDQIIQTASKERWKEVMADIQFVVRLRYRDQLKRHHEEFYSAWSFQSGTVMAPEKGAALFRSLNEPKRGLQFVELTPERVVSLMMSAPVDLR